MSNHALSSIIMPIWMEEDFHKKHSKLEEPDKMNEIVGKIETQEVNQDEKRFFS